MPRESGVVLTTRAHPKSWKKIAQGLGFLGLPQVERDVIEYLLWHGRFLEWTVQESVTPAQYLANVIGRGEEKTYRRAILRLQERTFLLIRKDTQFRPQMIILQPLVDACEWAVNQMEARRRIGAYGMFRMRQSFPGATDEEIVARVQARVLTEDAALPKRDPYRTRRAVEIIAWERREGVLEPSRGPAKRAK